MNNLICTAGYCERHKTTHKGLSLVLCLEDSERGEKHRILCDKVARGEGLISVKPVRPKLPKTENRLDEVPIAEKVKEAEKAKDPILPKYNIGKDWSCIYLGARIRDDKGNIKKILCKTG